MCVCARTRVRVLVHARVRWRLAATHSRHYCPFLLGVSPPLVCPCHEPAPVLSALPPLGPPGSRPGPMPLPLPGLPPPPWTGVVYYYGMLHVVPDLDLRGAAVRQLLYLGMYRTLLLLAHPDIDSWQVGWCGGLVYAQRRHCLSAVYMCAQKRDCADVRFTVMPRRAGGLACLHAAQRMGV